MIMILENKEEWGKKISAKNIIGNTTAREIHAQQWNNNSTNNE